MSQYIGQYLTFIHHFSKIPCFLADVAQLVRALDCGSKGRGFETRRSPFFIHSPLIHPESEKAVDVSSIMTYIA